MSPIRRPRPSRNRLELEALEERDLMAFGFFPGDLDPRFSGDGTVEYNFQRTNTGLSGETAVDVAVQPDDAKIVVAGNADRGSGLTDFAVLRYNPDGTLDPTFGGLYGNDPGTTIIPIDLVAGGIDRAAAVVLGDDGSIYVVGEAQVGFGGNFDFAVAKLDPNGNLDPSFGGGDGIVTFGFDGGGRNIDRPTAAVFDQAGDLVIVGNVQTLEPDPMGGVFTDIAVVKMDTDGNLDASFGVGGIRTVDLFLDGTDRRIDNDDFAYDIAIDPLNGTYFIAGAIDVDGDRDAAIIKMNPDGSLDDRFGDLGDPDPADPDGFEFYAVAGDAFEEWRSITVDQRGRVVVAGTVTGADGSLDVALARVEAAFGLLDPFFDGGDPALPAGVQIIAPSTAANAADADDTVDDILLDDQGRILLVGTTGTGPMASAVFVARVEANGGPDSSFGRNRDGIAVIELTPGPDRAAGIATDPAGNIVFGGRADGPEPLVSDFAVGRLVSQVVDFPAELGFARDGRFFFDLDRNGTVDVQYQFGSAAEQPLVADFDGDGRQDLIAFRDGDFRIDVDRDGVAERTFRFGDVGDLAFLADVDLDGIVDPIVYDDDGPVSVWRIDTNRDGVADRTVEFGIPGDRPLVGDFNGDNVVDLGVYRNGPATSGNPFMQFFFDTGGNGGVAEAEVWFGVPGDEPFLGDFNNDGRLDPGVFRFNVIDGVPVNQYFFDLARDGGAAEAEVWVRMAQPGDDAVFIPPTFSITTGYENQFGGGAGRGGAPAGSGSFGGAGVALNATPAPAVGSVSGDRAVMLARAAAGSVDAALADPDAELF